MTALSPRFDQGCCRLGDAHLFAVIEAFIAVERRPVGLSGLHQGFGPVAHLAQFAGVIELVDIAASSSRRNIKGLHYAVDRQMTFLIEQFQNGVMAMCFCHIMPDDD